MKKICSDNNFSFLYWSISTIWRPGTRFFKQIINSHELFTISQNIVLKLTRYVALRVHLLVYNETKSIS